MENGWNPKVCSMCDKTGSEFRCACKGVYYCSVRCQKEGWSAHKPNCCVHLMKRLKDHQKTKGKNDPSLAKHHVKIAKMHKHEGRLAEAEVSYKQAYRILKVAHGSTSKQTEDAVYELANLYELMGRHEDANDMHKASLEILRQGGASHDRAREAYLLNKIGSNTSRMGDMREALDIHMQSLGIQIEALGREHDTTAKILGDIGTIHCDLGNLDLGVEILTEALRVRRCTNEKPDNESMAKWMLNIANAHYRQNLHDKALSMYEETLAEFRRVHGEKNSNPNVAGIMYNMANIDKAQGRHEEALTRREQALEMRRQVYGDHHPDVILAMISVGASYSDVGREEDALEMYRKTLKVLDATVGPDHPHVAPVRWNIFRCHMQTENICEEAMECLKEAHRIYTLCGIRDGVSAKVEATISAFGNMLYPPEAEEGVVESGGIRDICAEE